MMTFIVVVAVLLLVHFHSDRVIHEWDLGLVT